MIKQCKGKDINMVPTSRIEDKYIASIKYDGHYVQIHKSADTIKFFTSGGKEFYIEYIAEELIELNKGLDFIIEGEYIADTDGTLGCRGKAAKLTTYRTNFAKSLYSGAVEGQDKFMIFDLIQEDTIFSDRLYDLKQLKLGEYLKVVSTFEVNTLDEAIVKASSFRNLGFEGLFLKAENHIYKPGKRLNTGIKVKARPSADLLCIDIEQGEGKYTNMIGSLILTDKSGRVVNVGSGLADIDRARDRDYFVGKVIEIDYEQIMDTYIQPTYKWIRLDKTKEDIN